MTATVRTTGMGFSYRMVLDSQPFVGLLDLREGSGLVNPQNLTFHGQGLNHTMDCQQHGAYGRTLWKAGMKIKFMEATLGFIWTASGRWRLATVVQTAGVRSLTTHRHTLLYQSLPVWTRNKIKASVQVSCKEKHKQTQPD